ncbi:MAG: HD domain-containing phosphohydrolase [Planctomycetota bacterium]|jgi:HD-GYP domain-containing protein (c-di-GMP phosphodiesterase class II)
MTADAGEPGAAEVQEPAAGSAGLSLRWKLLLAVALPILLVYVVTILGVLSHRSREARQTVERRMTETAGRHAATFDAALRELAQAARSTASLLESVDRLPSREALFAHLRSTVEAGPLCYGAAIAFAPRAYADDLELFSPYAFRRDGAIRTMDIGADGYDYTQPEWEWYRRPRETGTAAWTAPYFDEGAGEILMCTYAVPLRRNGAFAGVATVDVGIAPLGEAIAAAIPRDLDAYVVSPDGRFVVHPDPSRVGTGSIFAEAEARGSDDLRQLGEAMISGSAGVRTVETERGLEWVVFAPIASAGWSIAVRIEERAALEPVREDVAWLATVLGASLLLIGLSIVMTSGWITRPVERLNRAVGAVAGGDLEAAAPDGHRGDEIGELTRSFNRMRDEIKRHIERQAESRDALIFSLAKLAESRDNETGRHLERICRYVEILAEQIARERDDVDDRWVRTITVTAALHDIGKVGIPDAVLCKPGKLTNEEYGVIKKHTTIGGDTLLAIKQRYQDDTFLRTATEIAFAHHERWDGTGYPFGLAEEDIALSARIVSVADVYDALTSKRVYKPGMPHEEASRLIVEGAGTQFDPAVVAVFQRVEDRIRAAAERLGD